MFSKKKIITITLIITLFLISSSSTLSAETQTAAEELHIMDKYPGILWNDTSLVPMRAFLEGLGMKVEWVNDKKFIIASYGIETVKKDSVK